MRRRDLAEGKVVPVLQDVEVPDLMPGVEPLDVAQAVFLERDGDEAEFRPLKLRASASSAGTS